LQDGGFVGYRSGMKWKIVAIGRPSLKHAKAGIEEYTKRLRRHAPVEVIHPGRDAGREANSARLLEASEGGLRIVLDERGESFTTEGLAQLVRDWQLDGAVKQVAFLVGGADGHTDELRSRADRVLALSSFTLQHELALLVLLEQIYRIHTLLRGEPYHR